MIAIMLCAVQYLSKLQSVHTAAQGLDAHVADTFMTSLHLRIRKQSIHTAVARRLL